LQGAEQKGDEMGAVSSISKFAAWIGTATENEAVVNRSRKNTRTVMLHTVLKKGLAARHEKNILYGTG